jgi:hypothetical protein
VDNQIQSVGPVVIANLDQRVCPFLTILSDKGAPLVKIYGDGTLEYGEGYNPDEAAQRLWEAIGKRAQGVTLQT